MRNFQDGSGVTWKASVKERAGDDYKGRYYFVMASHTEDGEEVVELVDVRWNSLKTAERTLKTMSNQELIRRLRSARGRAVA